MKGAGKQCMPLSVLRVKLDPDDSARGLYTTDYQPLTIHKLKIVHIDDEHFVSYMCLNERLSESGVCETDYEVSTVYGRRRYSSHENMERLLDLAVSKLCLQKNQYVIANHTERCQIPGVTIAVAGGPESCSVGSYQGQASVTPDMLSGTWYEVERSRYFRSNMWESGVCYFEPTGHGGLQFRYAGTRHGRCSGPFSGYLSSTQPANGGEFMMSFGGSDTKGSPWSLNIVFKVMYIDKESIIIYTCHGQNYDGSCRRGMEQVMIFGRVNSRPEMRRKRLHDIIQRSLCVDIYELVEPVREEDCTDYVMPIPTTTTLPSTTPTRGCPDIHCFMDCPFGFKRDSLGCDTCICDGPKEAPGGSGEESSGEEENIGKALTSRSQDETEGGSGESGVCANVTCPSACLFGYQKDESGCQTCTCDSMPVLDVVEAVICTPVNCKLMCPGGYVRDEQGCETCKCVSSSPSTEQADGQAVSKGTDDTTPEGEDDDRKKKKVPTATLR